MNSADFGNSIVGNQLNSRRAREKLASKYKIGGKVKTRRGAVAATLKGKRETLRRKYATGGQVPQAAPMGNSGNSFWKRLQTEVAALNQNAQMPNAPGNGAGSVQSPASPLVAQGMMPSGQQAQPSASLSAAGPLGKHRGGRV